MRYQYHVDKDSVRLHTLSVLLLAFLARFFNHGPAGGPQRNTEFTELRLEQRSVLVLCGFALVAPYAGW